MQKNPVRLPWQAHGSLQRMVYVKIAACGGHGARRRVSGANGRRGVSARVPLLLTYQRLQLSTRVVSSQAPAGMSYRTAGITVLAA